MKNILVMTWFTLREALARKVFLFFLGISTIVIIIIGIGAILTDSTTIMMKLNPSQNQMFVKDIITSLELSIINFFTMLGLLLSIFSSASFVPRMLEKGNIDLLLSKPISRSQLLLGKYVGAIVVVLFNIIFLVVGIWFIISIKFSYWNYGVLWSILLITFAYAILNSVIVLFGVITKSSILGMMTAYILLIMSGLLLEVKEKGIFFLQDKTLKSVFDGLYYFFPKTSELLGKEIFNSASGIQIDVQPLITSFLFLLFIMIFSVEIFKRKDF